jgi:hypothetical protein
MATRQQLAEIVHSENLNLVDEEAEGAAESSDSLHY